MYYGERVLINFDVFAKISFKGPLGFFLSLTNGVINVTLLGKQPIYTLIALSANILFRI